MAAQAVFLPAALRLQRGESAIAPDASLSQSADILRMLTGNSPTTEQVAGLDAYLVTISITASMPPPSPRVLSPSTHAGLTSPMLAANRALKGPLHGGAPRPVLDMLDAVGEPSNARACLATRLIAANG